MTDADAAHTESANSRAEEFDTIVIGGGQTGLIVGHGLKEKGINFVILDASQRVGDAWRSRWDSLRLFTQAKMNGLPGMAFPGPGNDSVNKDQVADFLEDYATKMDLPVRSGVKVDRVFRDGGLFVVTAGSNTYRGQNVIVAMADYQKPKTPAFATDLDPDVLQMHSTQYKNPSQLKDGPVLVVGLGNTGADIAYEVANTHETWVAGTESGAVPFALEGWFGSHIGTRIVRFATVRVLNTGTPIGRKARPKMITKSAPLVRIRPKELKSVGVHRIGRIAGIENGKPVTNDGIVIEASNVIWCTGYDPGFDWIDLPVFDDEGKPRHERGIVEEVPGFYFVGLFFLHALWSETITGVQPDVRHIIDHLVENRTSAAVSD